MSRKARSDGRQQVYLYRCKGYQYASTQPRSRDPETGRMKVTRVLWGQVTEDLVFKPNKRYILASAEEKAKLVFPPSWDLSEMLKAAASVSGVGRVAYTGEDINNRLYGDIWLLEQICEKTGMKADLLSVFAGDEERVADLLTLAFFPAVMGFSYNRVERWQRICKVPSRRKLTPDAITRFMQSISEQNRIDFLRLRQKRLGNQEFLAVDSTSCSSYGNHLSSIRWGKHKESDKLRQTNDLVVYGLESHMPVYYRQLPGNIPDTRTLDVLLTELEHAGFGDAPLLMDREYSSMATLRLLVRKGEPFIMCAKVNWSLVSTVIDDLDIKGDGTRPSCFTVNPEYRLYQYQQEIPYTLQLNGGGKRETTDLRLNLYYDPQRRGFDIMQGDIDLITQAKELTEIRNKGLEVTAKEVGKCFPYYSVSLDKTGRLVTGFERNEKAVEKSLRLSGFIAIISHKVEGTGKRIWDMYQLRDEQEKLFSQLKTRMATRRCRTWSEEGYEGRLFVMFAALTFNSYLRHIWRSTDLKKQFSSSQEILDEMRSIRCMEHNYKAKKITPFIGKQLDICEAFGFDIPKGCEPASKQKRKSKKTSLV